MAKKDYSRRMQERWLRKRKKEEMKVQQVIDDMNKSFNSASRIGLRFLRSISKGR